ncbi:cupredoxin domain-containing protein [Natronosalvus caseinilyticus]|uniref:cupredoxin domain-containing protein n=1 Tax=Natronosalvus caseinilyticus TaxID=2953747 RepID=UPI0028A6C675|nr:plastocyanin [Natronosalvus caseinilyticus]
MVLLGATTGSSLVAGCLAEEEPESDDGPANERDDTTTEANDSDESPTGENETDGDESNSDGETTEDDGRSDSESDADRDTEDGDSDGAEETDGSGETAPTDVDEFVFEARTSHFTGLEPSAIADERNPTLVLTEGERYTITWHNADGHVHNVEIRDENEDVVRDYRTEPTDAESQSLTFEATADAAAYVCDLHDSWGQRGSIDVVSDGGGA